MIGQHHNQRQEKILDPLISRRIVYRQPQRAEKQISIRGLNRNCNHDLRNLFTGAAIAASSKPGPFQEFYTALLTKGIRPASWVSKNPLFHTINTTVAIFLATVSL